MRRPRWISKPASGDIVTGNEGLQRLIFELTQRFEAASVEYGAGSPEYACFKRHQRHFEQVRRLLWRGHDHSYFVIELERMMQDFRRIEARAVHRRNGTLGQRPVRSL